MRADGTIPLFLYIFFSPPLFQISLRLLFIFSPRFGLCDFPFALYPSPFSSHLLFTFLFSPSLSPSLLAFTFPYSIPSSLSLSPHLSVTFPAYAISAPTFLGAYIDHHVGNLDKRGRESKEEELHEAGKRRRKEEWKEGRQRRKGKIE